MRNEHYTYFTAYFFLLEPINMFVEYRYHHMNKIFKYFLQTCHSRIFFLEARRSSVDIVDRVRETKQARKSGKKQLLRHKNIASKNRIHVCANRDNTGGYRLTKCLEPLGLAQGLICLLPYFGKKNFYLFWQNNRSGKRCCVSI